MAREPARTPHEAEERYKRIISQPLACITKAIWIASPPIRGPGEERTLFLAGSTTGESIRLNRSSGDPVFLDAYQRFAMVTVPGTDGREWKASTRQYSYDIADGSRPVLQWHWHPGTGGTDEPHLHVRASDELLGKTARRLHIPSERIAFESVVRFLIAELGVRPLKDDWDDVTRDARARFVRYRSWP